MFAGFSDVSVQFPVVRGRTSPESLVSGVSACYHPHIRPLHVSLEFGFTFISIAAQKGFMVDLQKNIGPGVARTNKVGWTVWVG